jgi:hypothetical protein
MTKRTTQAALAFSAIVSLFLFQNCSEVGVSDLGSNTTQGKASVGNVDPAAEPSVPSDPSDDPAPPIVKNPGMDADKDCDDRDKDEDQIALENDPRDLAVVCLEASKDAVTLADGSDVIRNLDDSGGKKVFVIQSHSLGQVSHNHGHLIIIGMGANAHIDSVEHGRGRTTICNMNVDSISDMRGRLDLMDTKATKISDAHNIRMLRSEIGNASILETHGNGEIRAGQVK